LFTGGAGVVTVWHVARFATDSTIAAPACASQRQPLGYWGHPASPLPASRQPLPGSGGGRRFRKVGRPGLCAITGPVEVRR
jgi:hypothetical protein